MVIEQTDSPPRQRLADLGQSEGTSEAELLLRPIIGAYAADLWEDARSGKPNSPPPCNAADTPIDTPNGQIPVSELGVGNLVWTLDSSGTRVVVPLIKTGRLPALPNHEMVHIVLSGAREVWASPGHLTADGRRLEELSRGDYLDGGLVLSAYREHYGQPYTYDVLPAGGTGVYWANGVLLASTLE